MTKENKQRYCQCGLPMGKHKSFCFMCREMKPRERQEYWDSLEETTKTPKFIDSDGYTQETYQDDHNVEFELILEPEEGDELVIGDIIEQENEWQEVPDSKWIYWYLIIMAIGIVGLINYF